MKNFYAQSALLICLLSGLTAGAETVCRSEWTVKAAQDQHFLSLTITEVGTRGPACDLVVKNLKYLEGARVLALDVSPVRFCPVDGLKERQAQISWKLPFDLRSSGSLRLNVNGSNAGVLRFENEQVKFEGECQ